MAAKTAKPRASPATPTNNDVASLQVTLPEMLDLALGTPEVGAVNLRILHNFLHILLHQIDLRTTKVEYRGEDASRFKTLVANQGGGPTLYLQEYSIIDETGKEKKRTADATGVKADVVTDEAKDTEVKSTSAPVTERKKTDAVQEAAGEQVGDDKNADMKKVKGTRQKVGPGAETGVETVIFVEPIVDGATPTALNFKRLEHSVNELQKRFGILEELSTTPELIERLKGKITDPVSDIWQMINITKRLDASEQGIEKLTQMVQDVMKSDATPTATDETTTTQLEMRLVNLEAALSNLDQVVQNLQIIAEGGESVEIVHTPAETAKPAAEAVAEPSEHAGEHPQAVQRVSLTQLLGGIDVKEMNNNVAELQMEVHNLKDELKKVDEKINKAKTEMEEARRCSKSKDTNKDKHRYEEQEMDEPKVADDEEVVKVVTQPLSSRDQHTEAARADTMSKSTAMEQIGKEELQAIKERVSKLEKDVKCLLEKVDSAPMAGIKEPANTDDLVSKIHEIQNEMEKLNQTADRLIDDRENREMHLNALLEQVELLKTIKADREDLEDALAEKADAQAIDRKVSYDQFDAACDDLAQGLEDAISKLGQQETIWQQALEEVQKDIEGKVDKMEMSPLKDFVNNRLKSLQERLRKVAEARQEIEAAGTKKLLRDVQCISCDKDVVMRMQAGHKFRTEPLPCSMSMKPYLTYELDQVRKQHRRLPHSRNMIQFEAAIQEETKKQKSSPADSLAKTPRDHLCNRYCGGSHTVTTPQQRVMRMGHFITQWGPEIIQLTEGMVKGKDGKMYKSRRMPDKFDVCGPSYCGDHSDEARQSERPSISSVPSRKPVEKQSSVPTTTPTKKKILRRHSREIAKEVIEEVAETSAAEMEDQESVMRADGQEPGDQIVQYMDEEEEMGEQD